MASKNSNKKAKVAQVDFGFIRAEGLMLPDGSYAIAGVQANKILRFCAHQNHVARSLKRILGEKFSPTRLRSELNSNPVITLTLQDFRQLIKVLNRQGNEAASELMDALVDESIERRFNNAFGQKVEEEEYNKKLAQRMERVLARRSWTDQIKARQEQQGYYRDSEGKITERATEEYKELTIQVNQVLFGQPHFNCDRDLMSLEQQSTIHAFEGFLTRWATKYPNKSASMLVNDCLNLFSVKVV